METLNQYLKRIPPGPINNAADVESLLATCWNQFGGDAGGMKGEKLHRRMESVVWNPPRLEFVIERYGATVNGSSRADLQHWVVNLDAKTTTLEKVGRRQLSTMQPRLDVVPLTDEIARLILSKSDDARLRWCPDGRVRVLIGKIIPAASAVRQTLEGRRRRFRLALAGLLEGQGWRKLAANVYGECERK